MHAKEPVLGSVRAAPPKASALRSRGVQSWSLRSCVSSYDDLVVDLSASYDDTPDHEIEAPRHLRHVGGIHEPSIKV